VLIEARVKLLSQCTKHAILKQYKTTRGQNNESKGEKQPNPKFCLLRQSQKSHANMGGSCEEYHSFAHDCWILAKGDMRQAVTLFRARVSQDVVSRADRYIRRWGARKTTQSKTKSGRPRSFDDRSAKTLATIWKRGFEVRGQRWGFTSVKHASQSHRRFKDIVQQSGVKCLKTVMRSMKRVDKNIKKVHQVAKVTIPQNIKDQRMKFCKRYKYYPMKYFKAVTWVDETSYEVKMKNKCVSGDKTGRNTFVEDPFHTRNKKDKIVLNVALAVNYKTGPLHLHWTTGTTGVTHNPPFVVRKLLNTIKRVPVLLKKRLCMWPALCKV
jgi:hypothetical protein